MVTWRFCVVCQQSYLIGVYITNHVKKIWLFHSYIQHTPHAAFTPDVSYIRDIYETFVWCIPTSYRELPVSEDHDHEHLCFPSSLLDKGLI